MTVDELISQAERILELTSELPRELLIKIGALLPMLQPIAFRRVLAG